MARELPQNQIRPAAQPVSAFLASTQQQVVAPAGPIEIPRVQGVNVIQQGSGGSLAGVNQFEQLASALAPFSARLTSLAATGLEAYAEGQVQKGLNEAMRAKALLDAQQQQSAAEYAAENRRLDRVDPIAAMMMDRVNPFRERGRQRALVQLAAGEVKTAQIAAYRSTDGVQALPDGDPRLREIKARAVQSVLQKYRVNEAMPGFAQLVLPQINEGSDRITEMHWQDRQDFLKKSIPATAAARVLSLYGQSLNDGQIEVFTPDGRRELIVAGDPRWDAARMARMTAIVDELTGELGRDGEVSEAKREIFERLVSFASAQRNSELKMLTMGIQMGPPDKNGVRARAADLFGIEAIDAEMKYGEFKYKQEELAKRELSPRFQDELISQTYGLPDGPDRLQRIEALMNDPRFAGLSMNEKLELAQKTSTSIDVVTTRGRSVDGAAAVLQDMDGRYGTEWNPAAADVEFEEALRSAPDDKKPGLRQQYAQIRRRNNERESSPTSREVNGVIDRAIKANLRRVYPSDFTEAQARGVSAMDVMQGWSDANVSESARRMFSAYQGYVRSKIAALEGQKGRPLTAAEAVAEATKAIPEYGSTDPDAKRYLYPGINGQPGVKPAQARPPAGGGGQAQRQGPAGTRPFSGRVFPSAQLDNIPTRPQALSSWRQQPVLDAQSVVQEANRILAGGKPSAALQRFARDAGTTPGQLLNRHLDFYQQDLEIPAGDRQRLVRDGRQAQAMRNAAVATAGRSVTSPLDRAGGMVLDLLLGTRPAVAQPRLRSAVAMANAQAGGGSAGGGQVATLPRLPAGPTLTSPSLSRLATGALVNAGPHMCVASVLLSMHRNGLDPQRLTTDMDAGNNPRGLASQLVRKYGWRPLPGLGTPRTLNSPYGSFTANQMSGSEFKAAVDAGRIPSGAVVFQTHRDWAGRSGGSRGFDAAIVRDGGRNLWNGSMVRSPLVYGSATRQVFVLVPGDAGAGRNTARR